MQYRLLPLWCAAAFCLAACDDDGTDPGTPLDAELRIDAEIDAEVDAAPDMAPVPDRGVDEDAAPPDAGEPDMAPDMAPPDPACSDGADNDGDGLVDDDDPGCEGPEDDDETDPEVLCANGVDDDDDGLIDVQDPGCESDADFTEDDPEMRPACGNGRDDDADGLIDLADPGCQAAGDTDETDPPAPLACGNGVDDDDDGLIDYPFDPGCGGPGDGNEADPAALPACGNGEDDDNDGTTDYPADVGCEAAGDYDERLLCVTGHEITDLNAAMAGAGFADGTTVGAVAGQQGTCGGGAGGEVMFLYQVTEPLARVVFSTVHEQTVAPTVIYVRGQCDAVEDLACNRGSSETPGTEAVLERPQPGLYYVVVDTSSRMIGPGAFRITATEEALPLCDDDLDNDGDGRTDFPLDPGCESAEDDDETSPDPLPACADGVDNDMDELIDFPDDEDCEAAFDDSEARVGCEFAPNLLIVDNVSQRLNLNIPAGAGAYQGTCGGARGPEQAVLVRVRQASVLLAETLATADGARYDTLLYIRRDSCDMGQELDCDDDGGAGTLSRIVINNAAPGDYYVFSDAFGAGNGPIDLNIVIQPLGAACADSVDNDADGLLDGDDPGCASIDDDDEADDAEEPQACANGLDDDEDGAIDYPVDPGCAAAGDNDEADPDPAPECADGADNDADELIDFPFDPGCSAFGDGSEDDPIEVAACNDGRDNDGDGLIDLNDPGCGGAGDLDEDDPESPAACNNGVDDDADMAIDFPFDPGCATPGDLTEADPAELPACANGVDDDADEIIDFPLEPGCAFAADDDEIDPVPPPACGNGVDDDGDELIDFPADPGCDSAGDTNELNPAACVNGVDDDGDGIIDLADPGCANALDNDETDPDEPPQCADGIDNDDDGLIDFPDDDGCVAAGGPLEEAICGEVELPTLFVGQAGGRLDFVPQRAAAVVASSCDFGNNLGNETLIVITLDEVSTVSVTFEGARVHRYLRTTCDDPVSETACESGFSNDALSLFEAPPGRYYVFVEPEGDPAPVTAVIEISSASRDCNDGLDNDDDGLIDANDPGCRDSFDVDEADLAEPPACANGVDDDEDEAIDFPDDPECPAAGGVHEGPRCPGLDVALAEFGPEGGEHVFILAALEAGAQPEGAAQGSCDRGGAQEQVISVTVDELSSISVAVTDGDGPAATSIYVRTNCADPGSELVCASSFAGQGRRTLRDVPAGTYFFFMERSQFTQIEPLTATITVTSSIVQCNDEVDNDEDGVIDLLDPGCVNGADDDETDPDEVPECGNGVDDDEDELIDFPDDFGCEGAGDPGENITCMATDDVIEVLVVPGPDPVIFEYNTAGRENLFEASCAGSSRSGDQVFAMVIQQPVTGFFEITNAEPGYDTAMHMRSACDDPDSQIACNDDGGVGLLSRIAVQRLEPGTYFVIVDGFAAGNAGMAELIVSLQAAAPACSDGFDNDNDNLVDEADPGCEGPEDEDEFNEPLPQCSNGLDDDEDLLIDANDPGCEGPDDDDEFNEPLPACSNRLDDDDDGRIDAEDPGCEGPDDDDEVNPPLCSDEVDNDADELIDLADPGCASPLDDDEEDPDEPPACNDGEDNDEDGQIDWPDDAECIAAGDLSENFCLAAPDAAIIDLAENPAVIPFDTTDRENGFDATCGGRSLSPDQAFVLVLEEESAVILETTMAVHDTTLHVRSLCDDPAAQLACDDDGGAGTLSRIEFEALAAGTYFVIVDGFGAASSGPGELTVTVGAPAPPPPECSDGVDNDGDELIDADDPGCDGPDDDDETDPIPPPPPPP